MLKSTNLNSKRTVLSLPEKNLDTKTKALEMNVSFETAPASETAEKCAAAESLDAEAPKVVLPDESVAEIGVLEVKDA
jgi:hypothetical protein